MKKRKFQKCKIIRSRIMLLAEEIKSRRRIYYAVKETKPK
jgi:hypothetical protein